MTHDALTTLGWDDSFQSHFAALNAPELEPGRIVGVERTLFRVQGAFGVAQATLSGRLRHAGEPPPTVGDWVALGLGVAIGDGEFNAILRHVLPRKTQLSRLAPGRNRSTSLGSEQLLAANLQTVFIVSSFGAEFNVRRLERYHAAVTGGGARSVILLNKTDLSSDVEAHLAEVRAALPAVTVYPLSALSDSDFSVLEVYLGVGETVALIGSSGVGKSTLANRLLGREAAPSGAVREGDGKGRHTTTWREVFLLPAGGILIDNPGLREIGLWAEEVGESFGDVAALEQSCAYRDCKHGNEPGCAVQAALRSGELEPARFRHYLQLTLEAERVKGWVSDRERFRQETKARKKGIKAAIRAKGR